jgi:HAE1 family hydrophobic/amphiphilic exporter-1
MLMGLVTKNAILLVDYAKVLQARGMERAEAVITAGRTRLRPILMTTLAMIFGMLPLALGIGAGAEERAPMARAVVGGLVTSTFLTLLVVPVVYTLLDDFAARVRRIWVGKKAAAGVAVGLLLLLHGIPSIGPPAAAAAESAAVEILTLDEALRAAVANNRDVAKARELRTFLEGKYVDERAAALPQFLATAEALRAWDESQILFGAPPVVNRYAAQVGVSQPLYSSGAVSAGIRAAGKGLATADDRLRIARHAVLRDVHAAFHDILLGRELNRIAIEDRAQKARHLDEARKRTAAGTATDYDVLAAEVALRNAEPEVVRTENSIRTARERLRFLLGRAGTEVDAKGDLPVAVVDPPEYEKALGTAVGHRPELSDLRNRQGVAQELLGIARTGNRPRLDFRGALGWQEIDFGMDDVAGKTWSAGVFATWPLFDGLRTRGRVAQAGSDVRTLRIEEAQLLDAIALEVRDAVNAVREAGEIVNALAGTVDQADRLAALAEKGYEYGVKTRLDVDDAQLNRSRALGNLARARRDYLVAGAALRHATGMLGDGIVPPIEGGPAFRPAASPVGVALEVLGGRPALP